MSDPSSEALAAVERIDNTPGWIMDNERWRRDVVRIIDEELEPLRRENVELRRLLTRYAIEPIQARFGDKTPVNYHCKICLSYGKTLDTITHNQSCALQSPAEKGGE